MNHKRSTPRYAHAEHDHTDLCYSEDGSYIITCGGDGDIRIWTGIDDDDPKAVCVGEKAFCVEQKGDKLYVGSDNNNVQIYTFPDAELDGILTRFTAPVRTIDVSKDGSLVAAGSADMEIHVVEIATSSEKHFIGHKAPILHLAIDPKLDYLCSSSCDGTVKVWNISDQQVVKEWTDVTTQSNSFESAERLCHLSWETLTGRLLAIPFDHDIKVFQRSTWNVMMTLSNNQLSKKFSLTCWSSCGKFLAASTLGGEISVWNTLVSRIVSSSHDTDGLNISSLRWNPSPDRQELAFCSQGHLVVADNCFSTTRESKKNYDAVKDTAATVEFESEDFDFGGGPEEDEDDPEAISLEKIKSNYSGIFDGDLGSPKACSTGDGADDDSISVKSYSARPIQPLVELQPPFQPTSSPAHLQRRFMVFNDIGFVRQENTEIENMIYIDFHDASIYHAFSIANILNHSMAALNSEALVLACEKSEETTSKLVCQLFNSWDSSKDWNIEMMEEEDIQAIAVGNKWLAAATSFRFLRIYTLSGVQREILRLPGPVVCLSAMDDLLLIVYHSAMGVPGEQNLSFAVYQIAIGCTVLVSAQPLPLSPKSTLKWVGFSDQFNPCSVDSEGILSLFVSSSGLWKPICCVDARLKGTSNHHFIVGVSEERQNIRCILCKGSYYPSTMPLPFISEIPWQIPVCELSMDKGTLEETYWKCSIARECLKQESSDLNKEFKISAIKLFSLSCKSGHEMRVLEFCDFTNNKEVTDLALKYAFKTRNEKLAEKLAELQKVQLEMEMDDRSDCSDRYKVYSTSNGMNRLTNGDEYQSQELFPENRSSASSFAEPPKESVSLIAETKKMKSLTEQKNKILGQRKINPFRKSTQENSSPSVPTPATQECSSVSTPEVEKNSNNSFPKWYESQKESLKKEFPDLEEAEVTKQAAKKYRQLKKSQEGVVSNKTETENEEKEQTFKKRKSTDDEVSEPAPVKRKFSMKLQEFMFKKKE